MTGEQVNEEDLKRCDELMSCRDHWQLNTQDFNKKNLYALADEVPGLVSEVRKLRAEIEARKTDRGQAYDKERALELQVGELQMKLEHAKVDRDCCCAGTEVLRVKLEESNRLNGEMAFACRHAVQHIIGREVNCDVIARLKSVIPDADGKAPLDPKCSHEFVNQPLRGGWFCLNCNGQK